MEQKDIDIYEILKGMPDGTPLYTPMCGNVEFTSVAEDKEKMEAIWTEDKNGEYSFDKHGKWMKGGEVLLFPSDKMRDWSKFIWKKGDVLVDKDNNSHIVFEKFNDDTYTTFTGKLRYQATKDGYNYANTRDTAMTQDYHFEDDKDASQTYINTIEEKLGGKLNMETLEIEKLKPKKKPVFKLGNLYVFNEEDEDGELTIIGNLIGKNESEDTLSFGDQYEIENEKFVTDQAFDLRISVHEELREATELEVELFNKHCALWEKKQKEAKEQPAFKTFDKVLVRDRDEEEWEPAIFIRMSRRRTKKELPYQVSHLLNGTICEMAHCIPYEGNENIAFTDYDIEDLPF